MKSLFNINPSAAIVDYHSQYRSWFPLVAIINFVFIYWNNIIWSGVYAVIMPILFESGECGPKVTLNYKGRIIENQEEAFKKTADYIDNGGIVAVKGLGG